MTSQAVGRVLSGLPFPLEQGGYLQSEVALLAGLPKTTVRRWLQLERDDSDIRAVAEQPRVSFLDLISLRAVAALRKHGLRLRQIREGADYMRRALNIAHPLAAAALKTDGVNLYFSHVSGLLAVDKVGQLTAQELVDEYLKNVRYGAVDGRHRLALCWEPPGVTIDPELQRGAPCVAGSRVQFALLNRYVEAGDRPALLAQLFELDPVTVEKALDWYGGLNRAA